MKRLSKILLTHLALVSLVACGGGDGPAASQPAAASLTGTTAIGAPLANAAVVLKDASGTTRTATADASGAYTFADLSGLVAPVMLQARGSAAGRSYVLHSLMTALPAAGEAGVLNVTPATEAVTAQVLGQGPAAAFEDAADIKGVDAAALDAAKTRLAQALSEVFAALEQPATVDLFTTAFVADGTGLDKLLDLVGFSAQENAGVQVVQVLDKSSGDSVLVIVDAAEVPVLPKLDEKLVALDIASIKDLISSFNQYAATKEGIEGSDFYHLFDEDFLEEGSDRADMVAEIIEKNDPGLKLESYAVLACDGVAKTCEVDFNSVDAQGAAERFPTQVKLGTDGKWRLYGTQSSFEFDLKAVVQGSYTVSNGQVSSSNVTTGVNLWLPTGQGFQSAKLFVSNDNGATWNTALDLKKFDNCTAGYLAIDSGPDSGCGNFQALSDAQANATNAVIDQGKRKFKIEVYSDTAWTTKVGEFVGQSRSKLFTASTGAAALANSGLGITVAELGSGSVSFTGQSVDSVSASFSTPSSNATGNTTWEGSSPIAALSGKATAAAANELCKENSPVEICDEVYGVNAQITQLFLSARTLSGGVWANYWLDN